MFSTTTTTMALDQLDASYMAIICYQEKTAKDESILASEGESHVDSNLSIQTWCSTRCFDRHLPPIIHIELEFKLACTGNNRTCECARRNYSVTEVKCAPGKIHTVLYGVRNAYKRALLPQIISRIGDDVTWRVSGGTRRYVDREFGSGERFRIDRTTFTGVTQEKVKQTRAYLEHQITHARTCCGNRCGGGYSYTGCICMPCARPLFFGSRLLSFLCCLNRCVCPGWTYRSVKPFPKPIETRMNWFCSELCAAALMYSGVLVSEKIPGEYTPARLMEAVRSHVINADIPLRQQLVIPYVKMAGQGPRNYAIDSDDSDIDGIDDETLLSPKPQIME